MEIVEDFAYEAEKSRNPQRFRIFQYFSLFIFFCFSVFLVFSLCCPCSFFELFVFLFYFCCFFFFLSSVSFLCFLSCFFFNIFHVTEHAQWTNSAGLVWREVIDKFGIE